MNIKSLGIYLKFPKIGVRHAQALLLFFFLAVAMLTRTTVSIAIVAMTDNTTSSNPDVKTYHWTNTSVILSSFYWTYIILQSFAGYFFRVFGLKQVLLWSMFVNSIIFVLVPFSALWFGYQGVIACRMAQGLLQGFVFPALHTALGLWAPPAERSKLSGFIYSGVEVGFILSLAITGYISSSWYGWPLAFYLFGGCGVVWCVFWAIWGADCPATHPRISEAEKTYLMEALDQHKEDEKEAGKLPIKIILLSTPFWVLTISNVLTTWVQAITDLELPTYLDKVLEFDINSNGIISASTQVTQLVLSLLLAPVPDYLVNNNIVSLMNCRRIFQFFGSIVPAFALVGLAFAAKSQPALTIAYLNVIMGLNVLLMFGSFVNHIDLSPRYAGTLLGIENTMSQAVGMTGPLIVQYVVTDMSDIIQWRRIFLPLSVICILSGLVFMIFGSVKVQWWNSWKSTISENDKDNISNNSNKTLQQLQCYYSFI